MRLSSFKLIDKHFNEDHSIDFALSIGICNQIPEGEPLHMVFNSDIVGKQRRFDVTASISVKSSEKGQVILVECHNFKPSSFLPLDEAANFSTFSIYPAGSAPECSDSIIVPVYCTIGENDSIDIDIFTPIDSTAA